MGCLASAEERLAIARSNEIDRQLRREQRRTDKYVKLLLLGAGNSGKSTIVKQMKIIHDKGFSNEDYKYYKPIIYGNVITCMMQIIRGMDKLKYDFEDEERMRDARLILELVARNQDREPFFPELTEALRRLWHDGAVQECFERSSEYQLNDSAEYYLNSLDRIGDSDYIPTQEDLLRVRTRTTGVFEIEFQFKRLHFRLTDIGGQRTQRRKWIHCFENVTAVIFVAAINEYDMYLEEDDSTNRLKESLHLFDSILNNKYLGLKPMILFLNKTDLLKKKVLYSYLEDYFNEYTGSNTYDDVCDYIQKQFESKNRDGNLDRIYVQRTCATDTQNMDHVFKSVTETIIEKNLDKIVIF